MKKILFYISFFLIIASCSTHEENVDLTLYVNPLVGTDGHGHTFPGATLPFGMVQLSPDTRLSGWDGCSAYHFSDSIIYGFSHTHLSGTGCSDYGDILFMPTTNFDKSKTYNKISSSFNHNNEKASPGYYSVKLKNQINCEFTVTARSGFHSYSFPDHAEQYLLIDLNHRDEVLESKIEIINDSTICGYRISKAWAAEQHIYFYSKLSKPIRKSYFYINDSLILDSTKHEGKNVKLVLSFEENDKTLMSKVGISSVSIEGAKQSLENENPEWNFNMCKDKATLEWKSYLSKIDVEGEEEYKKVFYTALYHTATHPNIFNDVDGKYRGRDLRIHRIENSNYYTVFSLWDTYRAAHPLLTIIEPQRTNDFINTFIKQYEEGGRLPIWELAGNETDCMIGYHSVSVIADAFLKGIDNFDSLKAYEAIKNSSMLNHLGLDSYKEYGYIPSDKEHESVSKTLEYAYDDWCIAQMAKKLNKKEDYEYYMVRAQSYKNMFDPETKFMRAKENGKWYSPFNPSEVNNHYTEANSWQYSFYVPHDVKGLINLHGGNNYFTKKLDSLFTTSSHTSGRQQVDITGLIGQYAHGNEPSHHMAYLYSYAKEPWKTQQYVHEILTKLYSSDANGLCGNEDCGQMSAWYVLSAMGFYPVCPGSNEYIIGSPLFEKITINLENGKKFVIDAKNINDENFYIESTELNSKKYTKTYITHRDILEGGHIVFEMTNTANKSMKLTDADLPSSINSSSEIISNPYFEYNNKVFIDSQDITINTPIKNVITFYTTDGSIPNESSTLYTKPLLINKNVEIKAISYIGNKKSKVETCKLYKISKNRSIRIINPYNPQYSAGGDIGLIDQIRGTTNFKLGNWQGYQDTDFEAIVDLGETKSISKFGAGFLQDIRSWIWMPKYVDILISSDGQNFTKIWTIKNEIQNNDYSLITKDFVVNLYPKDVRYIKIFAKNVGNIPEWHAGFGGKSFIFVDEIIIE
ncbi:MAG TPA: hypothetical protein DDX39_05830 [Bacteroidales bacterium]|nr:MAG: hypothetical protein A2W98_07100 [Bacteroidetes bacterium GWF2_33_38]OFY76396.1 MAG: hypothetical protein A2265_01865 [Bacteroidetes bacterium RIFOXYA12_FULL_33_9]HBF88144.1 hypothetical protein [Bacteroidales bacterium]